MFTPTLFNLLYILIGCAIGFLISYICTIIVHKKKNRYPSIYNLDRVYCFQYIVHLIGGVLQTKHGRTIFSQNTDNHSLVMCTGLSDFYGIHVENGCNIIERSEDGTIQIMEVNLIICDQSDLFNLNTLLPDPKNTNAIVLVPSMDDDELRKYKHCHRYTIWTMENGKLYSRTTRYCNLNYMDYIYRIIEGDINGLELVQCVSFPDGPAPKFKEHMPIFMNNIFGRSYDQIKKDEDYFPY